MKQHTQSHPAASGPSLLATLKRSLRARLLLGTLLGMCAALILAGFVLSNFFSRYATKQFQASLQIQLDQLAASFEVDAEGKPVLTSPMTDPRFTQPLSGLYWQINDARQKGLARSRSLWDDILEVPRDGIQKTDGTELASSAEPVLHLHSITGPGNTRLLVLERNIRIQEHPNQAWQLIIASSTSELEHSIQEWTRRLILFLTLLFVVLTAAALAQVLMSLAPLRTLQKALAKLRGTPLTRLEGNFPQEVQPLIDDFNNVLDHSVRVVERARAQTGDLAHALKTPLAVLNNAATRSASAADHATTSDSELARIVKEQVAMMQRHIDWRLQRARTAATTGMPGGMTPVKATLEQLLRVMARLHAERHLSFDLVCTPEDLSFSGEAQDFQEMLGNVLDNASKWARSRILVHAAHVAERLVITIDDDGPGLNSVQYDNVLQRGIRADEKMPGSGLGLAIVKELAELYAGELSLSASPLGGLRVILSF